MPRFEVGDVVRGRRSKNHIKVTSKEDHWGNFDGCNYGLDKLGLKTGKVIGERYYFNAKGWNKVGTISELRDKVEKEENMSRLYEFKNTRGVTVYGNHMATNGDGLWVMDVKGAQPIAIKKEDAVEVIPHTIRVNISGGGFAVHLAEKGKYKVGQVFVRKDGTIVSVTRVDTKDKTTSEFEPISEIVTKEV